MEFDMMGFLLGISSETRRTSDARVEPGYRRSAWNSDEETITRDADRRTRYSDRPGRGATGSGVPPSRRGVGWVTGAKLEGADPDEVVLAFETRFGVHLARGGSHGSLAASVVGRLVVRCA